MTNEVPLQPIDESWQRALAIVAHPDDMEFGAAAAVARWTAQGKHVAYCLVTSGEAGIDGLAPDRCAPIREDEQRRSCQIVGVDQVEFLGLADGVIEYGVELRRRLAEVIRRHRPQIVITNNYRETYGGEALNQPDHMAVGRASLDAARDAGNRWIFHDQLGPGLEPWGGVQAVWAAGSPDSRHGVDITETFQSGVESLDAHRAYIDGLGWDDFSAEGWLRPMAQGAGKRLGCQLATTFEVIPLG